MRSQGAKLGELRSPFIVGDIDLLLVVRSAETWLAAFSVVDGTRADTGRTSRGFLAGVSRLVGRVNVEPLCRSSFKASEVLEELEMESRIWWNFRFVVLSA